MRLLLLFFLLTYSFSASEFSQRGKIIREVSSSFLQKDFKKLSQMAKKYSKEDTHTESGYPKITLFYIGIKRSLKRADFNTVKESVKEWIEKEPNSSIPKISYALILIEKGWRERGKRLAKYTSQKEWNQMKKYMREAREFLEKNRAELSKNPEYYVAMIDISKAENWDKNRFFTLLDEAIKKHPYYNSIYFSALFRMSPEWGNFSDEEIDELAQKALKATKEREGFTMYARVYWAASQIIYKDDLFNSSKVDWKKMKQGFKDIIKRYPSPFNLNHFAYFSCLAGDKDTTRNLLKKIGDNPTPLPWQRHYNSFQNCKKMVEEKKAIKKENDNYMIEIAPEELDKFIKNKTDKKPAFIHFASYEKGCSICDYNIIKDIAKKYHNRMNFVLVNTKNGYDKFHFFSKYRLITPPYSIIVFKRKILLRREDKLDYLSDAELLKYRPNMIKMTIDDFLLETKDKNYLKMFKESIKDPASLFNSAKNVHTNMMAYYRSSEGFKATAGAIDFQTGRWAYGRALREKSQEEANRKALQSCQKQRERNRVKDECRLHMIGDKYVYESNF